MKTSLTLLALGLIGAIACQTQPAANNQVPSQDETDTPLTTQKRFLTLGGEEQYIEIIGRQTEQPYLILIHGGPAWPQTPQFRYLNTAICQTYRTVLWEQRGAGNSYKKNPKPDKLSLEQIIQDGHELTQWLQDSLGAQEIYLAGYSWGSVVGAKIAQRYPDDYVAYIGIAQFINKSAGMEISQNWLLEQAESQNRGDLIPRIDSLKHPEYYPSATERFFQQYLLLNEFKGAVYNKEAVLEIEKATEQYDDYKGYDWYGVWRASSEALQDDLYQEDIRKITQLDLPVILVEGRNDWNVPSVLAQSWLNSLQAPVKKIYWVEKSGHGLLEEQAASFNAIMQMIPQDLHSL